jgi:hypothetical protein
MTETPSPWTLVDVMTATLGAASVILTAVAILIALGAFLGYRDLKAASMETAEKEARRIAENVAKAEIRAYIGGMADKADISAAYQDKAP